MNGIGINIDAKPGQLWTLRVNGELVARGIGKTAETQTDMEKVNIESTVSRNAFSMLRNFAKVNWKDYQDHTTPPKDRRREAAEGFLDGIDRMTSRFDCYGPGVPDAKGAKSNPSYRAGYDFGEFVSRCMDEVST